MESSHELNQYIIDHILPEEDYLKELERETHLTCIHPRMLSGHVQGKLLYMFCKMIGPKRILELGTYTGYSAINMGLAIDDDALIHTIEIKDELEEISSKYIEKANLQHKIKCHFGDAKTIVPSLPGNFDLVFIDADKREYSDYYQLVFDRLNSGGYIIADNILWDGKVVNAAEQNDPQTKGIVEFNELIQNDDRVENVIFPFRDGMMVIRKK
ncbi:MAG: O-methyltransferase [Prolixibacteraceae bacterium]